MLANNTLDKKTKSGRFFRVFPASDIRQKKGFKAFHRLVTLEN